VRKTLQSMLVHYHLATLGQYLEFKLSPYARYWINVFMRLDHFSDIGIMLAKCKIQYFTNHWSSINQRDAANIGPLSFQNVGPI